jgi:hypothetical protein
MIDKRALERPSFIASWEATASRQVKRIHHFPEYIELELIMCGIANADWL